ncbi:MAG: hypothetical protein GY854_03795 [Deltaproteobacteria bacterium]|nr:hypothetical protein [Deltaproteobacteria bacterium]
MRRFAFPAALVAVVAIHLALTFYFEPPKTIFRDDPNSWLDFDFHIGQVKTVTEALDTWGKTWAYDPQFLAGYPVGAVFDSDTNAWELWTFVLWKLGLSRGMAFNLFILLAPLMLPLVVFCSARLFGGDKWVSLLAVFFGMLLWFFDAFAHYCWYVGMISYGMAGYLFLLPLALFYRYLKDGRWLHLVLLAVFLSLVHLNHPFSFFMLVIPMLVLYARFFKKLSKWRHLGIVGAILFVLATNAYWLVVLFRFWHYVIPISFFCQGTPSYLLTDYLGLVQETLVTGAVGNRTGFRFLCLLAAVFGLVIWHKDSKERFWLFTTGMTAMLGASYLGSYFWFISQMQPYRYILPAMYFAVIPAATFFVEAARRGALRKLPRLAYFFIAISIAVAVSHLARDVLYFMPSMLPEPKDLPEDRSHIADIVGFGSIGYPTHLDFRHGSTFRDFNDVAAWIAENDDGNGRILVQHWNLAEHLAWRTNAQILGGFFARNLEHDFANLFRQNKMGAVGEYKLMKYLGDYAVKWVIVTNRRPVLELQERLLKPIWHMSHPRSGVQDHHRLYATTIPLSYFALNSGHVKTSLNRIEVSGTDPKKDVVLRFHWLETLVCRHECTIRREPIEHNSVGFIRVPAPHPTDFVIENNY